MLLLNLVPNLFIGLLSSLVDYSCCSVGLWGEFVLIEGKFTYYASSIKINGLKFLKYSKQKKVFRVLGGTEESKFM